MRCVSILFVVALALIGVAAPVAADSPITITSTRFVNNFRTSLSFQIDASSRAAQITRADLLVQVEGIPAIARVRGVFAPGTTTRATYEWNLYRDYLPPGATGQYWWEIQDAAGNQSRSSPQSFRVEDEAHAWKQAADSKLAVYWYMGADTLVATSTSDSTNVIGLFFAVMCALIALTSISLALIFRKRRARLSVFLLVALCAGALPLWVFRYLGEANSRGDARPIGFGQALFEHGINALAFLERDTGVTVERQIQVYVYGDRGDFFNALEPGAKEWTGGRAFPEYNVVLIDIAPSELEWGKGALAHELTHQVIHQKIRSPLGELSLPPLIDEGLAVYYESPGAPDPQRVIPLKRAIQNDALIPLRSLTKAFAADSTVATLSYAQSLSVVDFIFRRYGRDKMAQLLQVFKQGGLPDDVFVQVLGVNIDGLEVEWRKDIGAKPRAVPSRSLVTPTAFPTFSLSTEATPTPSR